METDQTSIPFALLGMNREPFEALQRTACRLRLVRQDPNNPSSQVTEWASGFHYGGGWIVTANGIAGVDGADVSNLWVYLCVPTEGNAGQPWREFPPTQRLCFCLRLSENAQLQRESSGGVCDIVAFELSKDERSSMSTSMNCIRGNDDLQFPQTQSNFGTFCAHFGVGVPMAVPMPDQPQWTGAQYSITPNSGLIRLGSSPWQKYEGTQWPMLYRTPVAAGRGSAGAPVFTTEGIFMGVHFMNKHGEGFVLSFVVVYLFMTEISPSIANVHRLLEYKSLLDTLRGETWATTHQKYIELGQRIEDNLININVPFRVTWRCSD